MKTFLDVLVELIPTILLLILLYFFISFYLIIRKYLLLKIRYSQKKIESLEKNN